MNPTERFLNACQGLPVDRPPVWLMRQAGRYMSSYQAVRKRVSFMELCRTPEIACEVTMMPIDQLGVDAAILFSDILVPLEPMGVKVWFDGGPQIAPAVRSVADIDKLRADGVADELGFVYDAVSLIRRELSPRGIPLLGFAGSPWTMASYLVEGGSSRHHHELKRLMYAEPGALHRMLDKLTRVVIAYLTRQVEAGAQAIQLFDTWGSLLPLKQWQTFSGDYSRRVIDAINALGVPTIHFAKGTHLLGACAALGSRVGIDVHSPLAARLAPGDTRHLRLLAAAVDLPHMTLRAACGHRARGESVAARQDDRRPAGQA